MLKNIFLLAVLNVVLLACGDNWKPTKIIGVEEYHANRVWVICKDRDGNYRKDSLFRSDTVNVFGASVYAEEYLSGKEKYGALPGQEKEYSRYRQQCGERKK